MYVYPSYSYSRGVGAKKSSRSVSMQRNASFCYVLVSSLTIGNATNVFASSFCHNYRFLFSCFCSFVLRVTLVKRASVST